MWACQLVDASTCSHCIFAMPVRRWAPITGTHICINLSRYDWINRDVVDICVWRLCNTFCFIYFRWNNSLCLRIQSHRNTYSHTYAERNRSFDATKHHAILGAGLRHYIDANIAARETAISIMATPGRCRPDAREREENLRNHGWQESNVQVLDAIGVGHQYHQSGAQAGDNRIRSHRANIVGRIVRYSTAPGRTHWLWHRLRSPSLHTSEYSFAASLCCALSIGRKNAFVRIDWECQIWVNVNIDKFSVSVRIVFLGRHISFVHVFHCGTTGPANDTQSGWRRHVG